MIYMMLAHIGQKQDLAKMFRHNSYLHQQKYRPIDEVNDDVESAMNKSLTNPKKKKEKAINDDLHIRSKKPKPPPLKHDQHWL